MTPNDPLIVGKHEVRAQRMESYVKDFKPMKMAVLSLQGEKGN